MDNQLTLYVFRDRDIANSKQVVFQVVFSQDKVIDFLPMENSIIVMGKYVNTQNVHSILRQ